MNKLIIFILTILLALLGISIYFIQKFILNNMKKDFIELFFFQLILLLIFIKIISFKQSNLFKFNLFKNLQFFAINLAESILYITNLFSLLYLFKSSMKISTILISKSLARIIIPYFLGIIFLKEQINVSQIFGIIIVIYGLFKYYKNNEFD